MRRAREDDPDEDRPAPKKPSAGGDAAKAAGMSAGVIIAIVAVLGVCCICLPVVGVLISIPAVQKVREAAARQQAMNNMKQIALAVHNYHDTHKRFPSPQMRPEFPNKPAPQLSWRVSILPYLDQGGLFNRFDKNENWDHARNRPLASPMPKIYELPYEPVSGLTQTKMQYFTGPATMFPTPLANITMVGVMDGTSNTFMFAEAKNGVNWTQVADMTVQPGGPLPMKEGTFLAAMGDGTVRIVNRARADENLLRLLINPRDGQALPLNWGE